MSNYHAIEFECAESSLDTMIFSWEPGCDDDLVCGISIKDCGLEDEVGVTLTMESAVRLRDELNKMIESHR